MDLMGVNTFKSSERTLCHALLVTYVKSLDEVRDGIAEMFLMTVGREWEVEEAQSGVGNGDFISSVT